jgi:hypothetical protein
VVTRLQSDVKNLTDCTGMLQSDVRILKDYTQTLTLALTSVIVLDFPEIIAKFHGHQFWILCRGGRNCFIECDFRRRCDRHANTPTVILDTNGNIFGSFTLVACGSWN